MLEAALVYDREDKAMYWHLPPGRSRVTIPDSRSLWLVLWEGRDRLGGVAHTHPGTGRPAPSREDLTTFAGCEAGLGTRLEWIIATADEVALFTWRGPGAHDYCGTPCERALPWLDALRRRSGASKKQPIDRLSRFQPHGLQLAADIDQPVFSRRLRR